MFFRFAGAQKHPRLPVTLLLLALFACLAACDNPKSAGNLRSRARDAAKSHATPHPPSTARAGAPRLAIILDDFGTDRSVAESVFALPYPLTLSFLPFHPNSREIAEEAHRRGYQVMLHLPMQSLGNETSESQQLRSGMTPSQISEVVGAMLQNVPYAVGVNNHQGSLATTDGPLMADLMAILRERNLFFIDSRTTAATVAYDAAQDARVRCAFRNVPFLDDVEEVSAIRKQLQLALRDAQEKGQAIAIGHPHPETLRALSEFLPQAEAQGVHLVHASDLVH
ncbi:MAG: divergent polysaccharide deacetylase family protein [Candidatus Acidiferrum sp.]